MTSTPVPALFGALVSGKEFWVLVDASLSRPRPYPASEAACRTVLACLLICRVRQNNNHGQHPPISVHASLTLPLPIFSDYVSLT